MYRTVYRARCITALAFQVFYKVLFHAAAVLPASKARAPVCVVLYNIITEAAQFRIAPQFAQGGLFYGLSARSCSTIGGPYFPQGLLLVISAA